MTYVPNADEIKVGGHTKTGLIIMAQCALSGSTSTGTFVESNGTSGYVVPGGKTLKIIGLRLEPTSTPGTFALAYSDNDLGYSGTTVATNPVYCYGSSANILVSQAPGPTVTEVPTNFDVPTGKYPGIIAGTFYGEITMVGYLY